MGVPRALPTPLSWARRSGNAIVPESLALGLILGIAARGWMRSISTDPEFTWGGTVGIIMGFAFFAVMQSVAALAATRPWRDWPRRGARSLGAVGLLPLFGAAGAVMAPAVVCAGLAFWHPSWPMLVRGGLTLIALANTAAVAWGIASDIGTPLRSLVGVGGLLLVYGCIVWAAAGTFSPPRPMSPAAATV